MDGLAQCKAQWTSTLQSSVQAFRTLISPAQASSKAWKPVPAAGAQAGASGGGNSSTFPPGPAAGSSSIAIGTTDTLTRRNTTSGKGKAAESGNGASGSSLQLQPLDPAQVVVHRRSSGRSVGMASGSDIYRAVAEVPFDGRPDLDELRALLETPESRASWDRMVEDAEVVEVLDPQTCITKTNFRLGWPASPRDAITISQSFVDGSALVNVSTSIPRSADAPAYLRPAPPFVRSHIHLYAWCIQAVGEAGTSGLAPSSLGSSSSAAGAPSTASRLRITLFWSWDLRGAWLGMPAGGLGAQLPGLLCSFVEQARGATSGMPSLRGFGKSVEVLSRSFDPTRDTLKTDYQLLPQEGGEDQEDASAEDEAAVASARNGASSIEWALPADEGWDVTLTVKAATPLSPKSSTAWKAFAERHVDAQGAPRGSRVVLRIEHSALCGAEDTLRAKVVAQRIAASSEIRLRLNNAPFAISDVQTPEPEVLAVPQQIQATVGLGHRKTASAILDDAASISGISIRTTASSGASSIVSSVDAFAEGISRPTTPSSVGLAARAGTPGSAKPARQPLDRGSAIAALVRRNYIYFTSLLQEPEAKWKPVSDTRGVTVTQLDSIDSTLVVYRAEATFVGVSVWDIFSTICTPGARMHFDKTLEDAQLLEDVGDASRLIWTKTRAAWPVSARDAVMVETAYKSPSSVHVFSFSTDDAGFFPSIPAPQAGTIRTQVDLRGWSVEALSPTTVHITLIEQSDPKGWTSKSATPAAMVTSVAGVGDYSIHSGGPPVVTRLLGAKARLSRFDHDKATYRLEYELADEDEHRGGEAGATSNEDGGSIAEPLHHVECELRCDVETWATGLDLVVDPPPINVSCLRRHKLSQGGSGLWLTIEHATASLEDEAVARITVRKAAGAKEKGTVYVNGAKIRVDVDELKDTEVAELRDRKRVKPRRVPLDVQAGTPATSTSRQTDGTRKGAEEGGRPASLELSSSPPSRPDSPADGNRTALPTPSLGKSLSLQQLHPAESSDNASSTNVASSTLFSDEQQPRHPMTCALDVLFLLRRIQAERGADPSGNPAGWALVSQRSGLYIRRKLMESISRTVFVQRADKVVEGLTAEDISSVISNPQTRSLWDDKVEGNAVNLQSFGNGATTTFFTTKAVFPFRGRAFYVANLVARSDPAGSGGLGALGSPDGAQTPQPGAMLSSPTYGSSAQQPVIYHASASFPESRSPFAASKLNPTGLPVGKVLIDGWILETLDPYSSVLNYPIPSTRCTHVVAIDYAGSLPAAVNTLWNSTLPRALSVVEDFVKLRGSLPRLRVPPPVMRVLGDGRDDDGPSMVWRLADDRGGRTTTLLSSSFVTSTKALNLLASYEADGLSQPSRTRKTSDAGALKKGAAKSDEVLFPPGEGGQTPLTEAALLGLGGSPSGGSSNMELKPSSAAGGDGDLDIRRTTSVSSMRSAASSKRSARPSILRAAADARKLRDLVLLDVEIDLRQYPHGYTVAVHSELAPGADSPQPADAEDTMSDAATDTGTAIAGANDVSEPVALPRGDGEPAILSLAAASSGKADLPVAVSAFDLPPSAVLAASLDPSARPRCHLIRAYLPTTAFIRQPPSGGAKRPDIPIDAPAWYKALRSRGAAFRLVVRPMQAPAAAPANGNNSPAMPSSVSDLDADEIPVIFNGGRLDVVHVNQTSAMLQRESELEERLAVLRRAPPPSRSTAGKKASQASDDARLPALLRSPLAEALNFKSEPGGALGLTSLGKTKEEGLAVKSSNGPSERSASGVTITDAKDAAGSRPSAASSPAQRKGGPPRDRHVEQSSAAAGLMSVLNSYPLSRLGAAAVLSPVIANGGIGKQGDGSVADSKDGAATTSEVKAAAEKAAQQAGVKAGSSTEASANEVATQASALLHRPQFSLATLILVSLCAFLVGSLVRALLSPADFVISSNGSASSVAALEIQKHLTGASQGEGLGEEGRVAWREMRRLVEVKKLIGGWDLVVAVVRR